ncbi:PREDICTED: beta-glucuronosyltransferase GlcAT14A [Nicotiana attenuata]|uniref:Beta-glucuronosyltransferase glcat14a n=1 Tax=Nicotiana attenuata TaxID=49451 RepID=A0A314KLK4_NICAT|nr:PREDICTED: beta-glucuronosyltransferase GlcAT14A [Nicotiana attenuata]OIT30235.1 beta-glucuronosyltransferase glcat14a [Nicotiana attenuata]
MHNHLPPPPTTTRTTTKISTPFILIATTLFSLLLILSFTFTSSPTPPPHPPHPHPSLFPNHQPHRLLFHHNPNDQNTLLPTPPSIAYLISGSTKDSSRIIRLLFSIYHPRNQYLLHLDKKASQSERDNLALYIQSVPLFKAAQNVNFIGKADFVYPIGSSALSATLHGASVLLRVSHRWDWLINLSAADYPLVTQDDLLHILSYLPKDLNFVNHTSYIGWRESRKLKPIVVDPGLYLEEEDEVFYATQKRELPDAYQLFSGSSSAILSRKFIEFCILGTDNLPRTLLMYLSNSPSSASVYFPTILCNSRKFNRTTINHNMQYASFNSRQEARKLNSSDFNDLVMSGAAFATPFKANDPILDQIDRELLHHKYDEPVPGGWCLGDNETDKCTLWGDAEVLRPGPGAKRLEKHFVELFTNGTFRSSRCAYE